MTVRNEIALLVPLLALGACTKDHVMQEVTSTRISASAGGVAVSADGLVEVAFSAGALKEDTDIRIETKRGLASAVLTSAVYDFGPDGLEFDGPVDVRFVASGETRELVVVNVDEATPRIVTGSFHDRTAQRVIAPLEHFSSYATIVAYDPCGGKACGDACTICDPNVTGCQEPPGNKFCDPNGTCVVPPVSPALLCSGGGIDAGVPDTGVSPRPDASIRDAGTPAPPQESEPNDTQQTADVIQVPQGGVGTIYGALDPAGDADWFRVDVPATGSVWTLHAITHSQLGFPNVCNNLDTVLGLYDSQGQQLMQNDDNGTPCSELSTTLTPGTYYLRVTAFSQQAVYPLYYLSVTLTSGGGFLDAGVNDAGSPATDGGGFFDAGGASDAGAPADGGGTFGVLPEGEPNDTPQLARFIPTLPATIQGSIAPAGDVDLFSLNIPPGTAGTLRAYTYTQLGNPSVCVGADTFLTLYDGTLNPIVTNDDANGTSCSDASMQVTGGNSYFIQVRHFNQQTGIIQRYYLDVVLN